MPVANNEIVSDTRNELAKPNAAHNRETIRTERVPDYRDSIKL